MAVEEFTIGTSYREEVRIDDGTRILLRPIQPSDKSFFRAGFRKLSAGSRYRRFFSPKDELTEEDLKFFTEFDGYNHFALGALRVSATGTVEDAVGVARFIRLPEEHDTAEAAVTVVDELQGLGLGRILADRIIAAAVERQIRRFHCHVLAENRRGWDLIRKYDPQTKVSLEGPTVTVDFSVPGRRATPDS